MSKLADYLAKNYLTADPKPDSAKRKGGSGGKKRKRKDHTTDVARDVATATSGLIIADDDVLDWGDVSGKMGNGDEDRPLNGTTLMSYLCG